MSEKHKMEEKKENKRSISSLMARRQTGRPSGIDLLARHERPKDNISVITDELPYPISDETQFEQEIKHDTRTSGIVSEANLAPDIQSRDKRTGEVKPYARNADANETADEDILQLETSKIRNLSEEHKLLGVKSISVVSEGMIGADYAAHVGKPDDKMASGNRAHVGRTYVNVSDVDETADSIAADLTSYGIMTSGELARGASVAYDKHTAEKFAPDIASSARKSQANKSEKNSGFNVNISDSAHLTNGKAKLARDSSNLHFEQKIVHPLNYTSSFSNSAKVSNESGKYHSRDPLIKDSPHRSDSVSDDVKTPADLSSDRNALAELRSTDNTWRSTKQHFDKSIQEIDSLKSNMQGGVYIDSYIIDTLVSELTPTLFIIYLYLWRRTIPYGQNRIQISNNVISKATGFNIRTIIRSMPELNSLNLIKTIGLRTTAGWASEHIILQPWKS